MKYSIIIPVYNAAKTLNVCIDSILAEKEENTEIILVNDGSSDESLSICRAYANINSNVLAIDKKNGGAASARNVGIEKAVGEYIVFVDSDDTILPGYFQMLDSTDSDLVVFGTVLDNRIEQKKSIPVLRDGFDAASYIVFSRDGSPWNKRFKREIIMRAKVNFPEDLSVGEDFIFCLRYALNCSSISLVDKALYCYNIAQEGSLTHKFRLDYIEEALRIYNYAFQEVERHANHTGTDRSDLRNRLDYNYCRTAFVCATIPVNYRKTENLDISEELSKIMAAFSNNMRANIAPTGFIHRVMRGCLRMRLILMMKFIAAIAK